MVFKPMSIVLFAFLIGGLFLVSCDKRSVELPSYEIEYLGANPMVIYADNDDETNSVVSFKVKDSSGKPVVGEKVVFLTTIGKISEVETDGAGVANGIFMDTGTVGIANIEATLGKSKAMGQVTINEKPDYIITKLIADPDTIYADNNLTFSRISAHVMGPDSIAVVGETVTFRTNLGRIWAHQVTDSTGVATVDFWDDMDIGKAKITATIGDISKNVYVQIDEAPEINDLSIEINTNVMKVDEVISVKARAKNILGNDVQDGTLIRFSSTAGSFDVEQVQTVSGIATAQFNAGVVATDAVITVAVGVLEESANMTITHGAPSIITLKTFLEGVEVGEIPVSTDEVEIKADVQDKYHNPVKNKIVNFETTLGDVNPHIASTDNTGLATSFFNPGNTSGEAEITATADSTSSTVLLDIYSEELYSLNFVFDDQLDINIRGTGTGNESATIEVVLRDENDNQIDVQDTVYFMLDIAPDDSTLLTFGDYITTIEGEPIPVISSNGLASCTITSGYHSGTCRVKVFGYDSDGQIVQAVKTNIVVHSGPPSTIHPFIGDFNTGVDMGGGLWEVIAGAIITDTYGNPVDKGTAVHFSLLDPPENCEVYGSGFIGNQNTDGDSVDGVAFTTITYSGANTFDKVKMQAECGGIIGVDSLLLPLNEPTLELNCLQGHIDFFTNGGITLPASQYVDLVMYVSDAQGNPINHAVISLTANRGFFIEHPDGDYPQPNIWFKTRTYETGIAYARILFYQYEIEDPVFPITQTEDTVIITGVIIGTEGTSAETTITLRNYLGTAPVKK